MNKIQISEEQAKDLYFDCVSDMLINYNDFLLRLISSGYIKKTDLEKTKKEYEAAKKFIINNSGAGEPFPTENYINKLEKEIERLKNEK